MTKLDKVPRKSVHAEYIRVQAAKAFHRFVPGVRHTPNPWPIVSSRAVAYVKDEKCKFKHKVKIISFLSRRRNSTKLRDTCCDQGMPICTVNGRGGGYVRANRPNMQQDTEWRAKYNRKVTDRTNVLSDQAIVCGHPAEKVVLMSRDLLAGNDSVIREALEYSEKAIREYKGYPDERIRTDRLNDIRKAKEALSQIKQLLA